MAIKEVDNIQQNVQVDTRPQNLEALSNQLLNEENAGAEAIRSLLTVDQPIGSEPSDIELKTDLSEDEHKILSVLLPVDSILTDKNALKTKSFIGMITNRHQRLALSKDRKSRSEIVAVARQPDFGGGFGAGEVKKQGMFSKLFSSKKKRGGGGGGYEGGV